MTALMRGGIVLALGSCLIVLVSVCFAAEGVEGAGGTLVAKGRKCIYVADQAAGKVHMVYNDGECVLLAEGFGKISGLAAAPDGSVYLMSSSKKRLFRIAPNGKVQMVRKVDNVPGAILVDRDSKLFSVECDGEMKAFK